ncbi:hypothetical protein L1049_003328 [Liquidambar formosana]|uniref:Uncharacterized protein n=1 Tax=Liquidambar formosana TaxID=63359 RepID=A0AAP0NM78_LIQFO
MAKSIFLLFLLLILTTKMECHDSFYLVQHWTPSLCNTLSHRRCVGIIEANFTIQGLWPKDNNQMGPLTMCSGTPFNYLEIESLECRLNQNWPDMFSTSSQRFWEKEWESHGTCSESTLNQYEYFRTTLELKDRYDLVKILDSSGFHLGGNYDPTLMALHIYKAIGVWPIIGCNKDRENNEQLWEVILCVDISGTKIISCDSEIIMNCSENTGVNFPV